MNLPYEIVNVTRYERNIQFLTIYIIYIHVIPYFNNHGYASAVYYVTHTVYSDNNKQIINLPLIHAATPGPLSKLMDRLTRLFEYLINTPAANT